MAMGRIDHVILDQQIIADKIRRMTLIGINSTDPGRRQKNVLRPFRSEKGLNRRLAGQIQFVVPAQNQVAVPPRSVRIDIVSSKLTL